MGKWVRPAMNQDREIPGLDEMNDPGRGLHMPGSINERIRDLPWCLASTGAARATTPARAGA
jgi:hypothetical protein